MTRPLRRGAAPALLVLSIGLGLAGCSGDGDEPGSLGTNDADSPSAGQSPTANTISPQNLPVPPTVANKAGAVADITFDDCATDKGTQTVTGSVENPTKKQVSYVIQFDWINDTSDVLGRGFAVVKDLGSGKSADWEISAKVVDGATQCVPNVVRGELKTG